MPGGAAKIGRYGDSEQKALLRIQLKPGEKLVIRGKLAPCTTGLDCDASMQSVSIASEADILYQYGETSVLYEAGKAGPTSDAPHAMMRGAGTVRRSEAGMEDRTMLSVCIAGATG